ncbi:MAG TPA: type II secretion system F family protein [Candidatus Dormibacteraeota bacterium]|jgi:Flp pilus assembly protein TadB|nr:type II secretion system F family protein [Candidatus Dormibacteraeota bacterium]
MSSDLLIVIGVVVLVVALIVAILLRGRARSRRQNQFAAAPGAPTDKDKAAVLRMRNQARRLPALGLLVQVVRRGPLPRLLDQADVSREVSVEDVARMKLLTMLIFAGLGLLVGAILGNPVLAGALFLGGLMVGFGGPDSTIKQAAEVRQNHLSRALPLALEVIGLSVERTSIDAGIAYYCQYFGGEVLAQELAYVIQRVQQLKERLDVAMGELLRKNRNDDLSFLVAAVGQATQIGGRDLRQMLAQQAEELRIKREQEVKGRSLKAPVLMTFPTMLNVLALLIVLGSLAFLQIGGGTKHG